MPGLDGTGPAGAGAMSGRGLGACAGGRPTPWSRGGGRGRCAGFGPGMGLGRGMGWFSVGYGESGQNPAASIRGALEERKEFLRAELERTEALLKDAGSGAAPEKNADVR